MQEGTTPPWTDENYQSWWTCFEESIDVCLNNSALTQKIILIHDSNEYIIILQTIDYRFVGSDIEVQYRN